MSILKIENLEASYQTTEGEVKAIGGVNLEVREEEVVGLVGESGCGKSSLGLSILRLIPEPPFRIVRGKILFKGRNLLESRKDVLRNVRGKEISMIFQDPTTFLNPVIKVEDQIAEMIRAHKNIPKAEVKKRVIELLEAVQISSPERVAKYYPFQLSGGMSQRVFIAMALSCDPNLVIADEPTTALDTTLQAQILQLLKNLREEMGLSMLLISHDLGIIAEICDTVYVMYAGKIVERANVSDIYTKHLHPYTQGLMRAVLSIDEFKKDIYAIEGNVPDLINPPRGCRFHPRCSEAMEICKKSEPPMVEHHTGHVTYCWLYGQK